MPASWRDLCTASSTCPDSNEHGHPRRWSTPEWWCKHIAAAFYTIAAECDKDPAYAYKLSGYDFKKEAARKRVRREVPTSGGNGSGSASNPLVLSDSE